MGPKVVVTEVGSSVTVIVYSIGGKFNSDFVCLQSVSGPATSDGINTMRQSAYLVLLTLQKTTNDAL